MNESILLVGRIDGKYKIMIKHDLSIIASVVDGQFVVRPGHLLDAVTAPG